MHARGVMVSRGSGDVDAPSMYDALDAMAAVGLMILRPAAAERAAHADF